MEDNKPIYILDASVILKWILKEEKDREQALLIRNHIELGQIRVKVPAHCFTEVLNVVALKSKKLAVLFLEQLQLSFIQECRLNPSTVAKVVEMMQQHSKIAFYDAIYHGLAFEYNGIFVTADERYYQAVDKEGRIIQLKHYSK